MKSHLYTICMIVLSTLLSSCGPDAPPLSCSEWTPECELQKEYICFQYIGDTAGTVAELRPIDAMGVPLQPGITYMASTKLKAPVPVLYDNVLDAAISTGRAKMMKWSLPMEYGNSGTATKVNLLLTGGNELQPGEFHAGVAIKWHEELGANQ